MSRIGVTFNVVAEAADRLSMQGENPTIERVRVHLGGKGSNTTLSKYLNMWRHQTQQQKTDSLVNDTTASGSAQAAVARAWRMLREETDVEIEAVRLESQALIKEAEAKTQLAIQQSEHLQNACDELQQTVYSLQASHEMVQLDYKKQQEAYNLLQERYKSLDQRYAEYQAITSKHQTEITNAHQSELHLWVEKSKSEVSTFQKLVGELQFAMEEQRHRYIVEIDAFKTQIHKLEKERDQLQSDHASQNREINALKIMLATTTQERDHHAEQIKKQEANWKWVAENTQLTEKIWHAVEVIPKFDLNHPIMQFLHGIQVDLQHSMDTLKEVADTTLKTMGSLQRENGLKGKDDTYGNDQ